MEERISIRTSNAHKRKIYHKASESLHAVNLFCQVPS
jgi:hypothetical protein